MRAVQGWARRVLRFAPVAISLLGCADPERPNAVVDAGAADAQAQPPTPASEPGRHVVEVIESRRVVPSSGLPAEATVGISNNNLDVVRHDDGRVYLAWRTAPDHLAGKEASIQVVSSADELDWRFEARYQLGTDVREPRLLSWGGALFLHVAMLGSDPLAFEPRGVARAEKVGGAWSALGDLGWGAYIVWRTRVERGTPYMVRYLGGEHIYRFDGLPLSVEFLTSADGRTWAPVDPARPVAYRGGGSEADIALAEDGTLVAVIRNEAIDDAGFGSRVCQAPAAALGHWTCRPDPRKFDSPLLFAWDGEIYLVARRNLTASGAFDLMRADLVPRDRVVNYQLAYLAQPKRCAIWRYVREESRIAFVVDLPSRGDTCFPAYLPGATPDTVVLYNYSSDPDGPELTWYDGQRGPTFIYRHVVRFRRRS